MAKSPESFPEDDDIILSPLEDEDLTLEPEEPAKKVEQKQPKKETKVEAKEEDSFTVAGKTYERGQAVKFVVKKDDGSEYIEDWKFFGVTTHPSTGEKIIVVENKEGGKMNYPMDMFEEGLGGRQLETSLRFEDKQDEPAKKVEQKQAQKEVKPEIKKEEPPVPELLRQARKNLETTSKPVMPWVKEAQKKNIERIKTEIKELQERLREIKIGGGNPVRITEMEDITFKGTKGGERQRKELTVEDLELMHSELLRLPFKVGSSGNVHDAVVRFIQVEGSDERDLIFVFGQQDAGETIAVDQKEVKNLIQEKSKTSERLPKDDTFRTKFNPGKKLEIGGRKIREVRLFVPLAESNEKQEKIDTMDSSVFQKRTTDYVDRFLNKNKKNVYKIGVSALHAVTGIDLDKAWQIREELKNEPNYLGTNYDKFLDSLAGIDSKRAWDCRDEGVKKNSLNARTVRSLVGLDSDQAMKMRENIYRECLKSSPGNAIMELSGSLAGLNSDPAWEMRDRLLKDAKLENKEATESCLISSLTGLDSKKAWDMRERLLKTRRKGDYIAEGVAHSLAGLNSPEAWEMRELLIARAEIDGKGEESGEKNSVTRKVLLGLAGVDSPQAWKMRDELLKEGKFLDEIARSMAGIDSDQAWNMRGRLIIEGCHEDTVLQGIYGGTDMVAVRKARRDKIKKRK